MSLKRLLATAGLLTLGLLPTGCISIERHIEFSDVDRLKVTFENKEAARIFFGTMSRMKLYHSEQTIQTFFLVGWRVRWNLHETEWFNHQVRRTDIDGNGLVTEQEAKTMIKNLDAEEQSR